MAVVEKQLTEAQKQAEAQSVAEKESGLTSRIEASPFVQDVIDNLDLSHGLATSIEKKVEKEEPAEEVEESTEKEEVQEEPVDEKTETEEKSEESEDSDLIPKSKVQKRIDELTREKKILEARLTKLEQKSNEEVAKAKDPDLEKLESMSEVELRKLKREIRVAQISSASDGNKLAELMELEDKVENVLNDSPKRFQDKQTSNFYEAVNTTDIDDKAKQSVFAYAKSIFMSTPEFQSSITGQARAWNLAVEHYKELNKLSNGKSSEKESKTELERKVNTLKKKISLETSLTKGNVKANDDARLYNKARVGSDSDKLAFFKKKMNTDNLIPEEFRQ